VTTIQDAELATVQEHSRDTPIDTEPVPPDGPKALLEPVTDG
jgi:hypothetical protein